MQFKLSFSQLTFLASLICLIFLGSAYFIEYHFHQMPCSLCILQRYVLWALCGIFFIATLHSPHTVFGRYAYAFSSVILSLLGLFLALRQIWIQHLPREAIPNCVADLERLLKFKPVMEVMKTIFVGGGECHEAKFTILGLSLAEASALVFLALLLLSSFLVYFAKPKAFEVGKIRR